MLSEQTKKFLGEFCRSESGATAIEYALISGIVSMTIIAAVQSVATESNVAFNSVSSAMAANNTP